jgi:hypothetical protein
LKRWKKHTKFESEYPKGRDYVGDLGMDERIRYILRK